MPMDERVDVDRYEGSNRCQRTIRSERKKKTDTAVERRLTNKKKKNTVRVCRCDEEDAAVSVHRQDDLKMAVSVHRQQQKKMIVPC